MGKTGSTLRVRLSLLINMSLDIQQRKGYITPKDLSEKSGLTDRAIRDYIHYLTTLGVLDYVGGGKYTINEAQLKQALQMSWLDPRPLITLEDFVDPVRVVELAQRGAIDEKVRKVLERMKLDYIISGRLREQLRKLKIDDELASYGFEGDYFILRRRAKDLFLDNIWVAGTAASYSLEHFRYRDFLIMSIVFLSAGGYLGYFRHNILDQETSIKTARPRLETYKSKEPFLPGDPFYEMTSDFPELLESGRKIAARYLMEYQHLSLDYEMIRDHSDKFNVLFRHGSLVPHGFIVGTKHLIQLRDKVHKLFKNLIYLAEQKKVKLIGISFTPHDNYLIQILNKTKKLRIGETSDLNLLFGILEDGEVTCPVKRRTEKGRPIVRNWYEFYMKKGNFAMKVEMLSDDPLKDQEKIMDLIYSLSVPSPGRMIIAGPSVVGVAQMSALENLAQLKRTITMSIKYAFEKYFEEYQLRRDEELFGE